MKNREFPQGPTLNGVYNDLLCRWVAQGMAAVPGTDYAKPECEDCGADLTGQEVHDARGWFCTDCNASHEEQDVGGIVYDVQEDFHADG